MKELHWWEHGDLWKLSGWWPHRFLYVQGYFPSSEELWAYTRSLSTQQLCRPQGEGTVKEQLLSAWFSPGPVLMAEGGLWAAPLCYCFCRSSVILRTPLSFGLSSTPCCSCIYCRMAHLLSTTTGSCLGGIPLAARAWPGDLWYFGWQTGCLCPAWYFPVKYALGCPFFRRHYPSSHSFLSPSIAVNALSGKVHPFLHWACKNPPSAASSPDSTASQLKRCLWGPAAGHICISRFASRRGLFKCTVQLHTASINTSKRGPRYCAALDWYFQGVLVLLILWISACCYPGMTGHTGGVYELFWWEEHTCLYRTSLLILVIFWSAACLWNYMEFPFFLLFFREKGLERHGAWKNHSRHADVLHPVSHPCSRPQVCWDRKIQYHCLILNSALIISLHNYTELCSFSVVGIAFPQVGSRMWVICTGSDGSAWTTIV